MLTEIRFLISIFNAFCNCFYTKLMPENPSQKQIYMLRNLCCFLNYTHRHTVIWMLLTWVISLYIRPHRDKHIEYTHQHAFQMNKLVYIHHLHGLHIPVFPSPPNNRYEISHLVVHLLFEIFLSLKRRKHYL